MPLYHRDIYLPESPALSAPTERTWWLTYTRHAKMECIGDYQASIIHPPRSVHFSRSQIIEAEIVRGEVIKLVVRIGYTGTRDLVLVLCGFEPGVSFANVKSIWTNAVGDKHKTLRKELYEPHP